MRNDQSTESKATRDALHRARAGDADALEGLLTAYKPLVRSSISQLYIPGADYDDLLQEGMIGLYKAILTFDQEQGAAFASYAGVCIRNHVFDQIQKAGRLKNQPLNLSLPLENSLFDATEGMESEISGRTEDPVEIAIFREVAEDMSIYIERTFSNLEKQVFIQTMQYATRQEIAEHLGVSEKSVENALYRGRSKLRKFWSQRMEHS
jgi:RNA polymerase sporulation-specific sigma factor